MLRPSLPCVGIVVDRMAAQAELQQRYEGIDIVFAGRYVACDGGLAELRRMIDLWIHGGQLVPMAKSA